MNHDLIARSFRRVFGQPCWGVHYQRQLNLSLNFGRPHLRIREPVKVESQNERVQDLFSRRNVTVRGQWWLWLWYCRWRFLSAGQLLATGSSSARRIADAVLESDGQKLTSVDVSPKTGATLFSFDLGGTLECRRHDATCLTDDLWLLYEPRGMVLIVQRDGSVRRKKANQ